MNNWSVVDANVILRYLLNDHPELSPLAEKILDAEEVLIRTEVICEVVYVLEKVYGVPRAEISETIVGFVKMEHVHAEERHLILHALETYNTKKLDFVDGILVAVQQLEGKTVKTFDKKLAKYLSGGL